MSRDDPPDDTDQVIEPAGIEPSAQVGSPRVANVSAAGTVTFSGTVEARVISAQEREIEHRLAQPEYVVHVLTPEHTMKLEVLLGKMIEAHDEGRLKFKSKALELDFENMAKTLSWSAKSPNGASGIAWQAVTWFYRNVLCDLPADATKAALITAVVEAIRTIPT